MKAHEKVAAMREGKPVMDGYGKPLARNARREWVNETGDTPCPNDGEMTNRVCWKCGWARAAGGVRPAHEVITERAHRAADNGMWMGY